MGKVDLNDEQRAVVEYYGSNMLVSAGAGSGKTRVVIAKLMDIIKNKRVSVTQLLVTTFTKAAGSQMMSKLASNLSDEIFASQGELQEFLIEQLELLPQASIGTLHTFCEKLVKKYFYAIDIEPTFKILEERDANFFKNEILDDIFENYTENNDEMFEKVTESFKQNRDLVSLKQKLNELLSFIKAKKGYIDFLKISGEDLYADTSKTEKILNDYILKRKDTLKKYYFEFLKDSTYIKSDKLTEYFSKLLEDLENINNQNSFVQNYKNFKKFKPTFPSKKGKNDAELSILNDLSLFNEKIRKKVKELKPFEKIVNIDEVEWVSNKDILDKLIEILQEFDKRYSEVKLEKNFLDFNDLEEYTLKILSNKELRDTISQKYKFIFVDEYQDTNEIQEEILSKISTGDNMIMVGDVKQSIYGFRNTSPEIFLGKYQNYEDNGGGVVKSLNMNYRSQSTILDYCNYLFGKIMTKDTCDIDYKNKQFFVCGNADGNNTSTVQFHILDKEENPSSDDKIPDYDINTVQETKRNGELDLLVDVIKRHLNTQIYDGEEKRYRPCQEKDICILCRTGAIISEVSKKLTEVKIPFTTTYNVELYSQQEINLILSFLQVIQNDFDDISLVTCLTSYYYGIQKEDLVEIRKKYSEEKFYYNAVKNYAREYKNDISQKINSFYEDIIDFRKIQHTMPLRELVEKIFQKYNIISYYSLKKDGNLRIKNLYTFLNTLNGGFYTQNLTAYLNYINGYAINDKFEVTVNGGVNSLKIQTIHASKGLEYNVVILFKPERKYKTDSSTGVLKDKDLGLAIEETNLEDNTISETLSHIAFKIKSLEQIAKEEMRLLYVALTRAKNKLCVVGEGSLSSLKSFESDFEISNTTNYFNLMLRVLEPTQLEKLMDKDVVVKFKQSKFEFFRYNLEDIPVYADLKEKIKEKDLDIQSFLKISNFEYLDKEAMNTRLKNTVTALQEENDEFVLDFSKLYVEEENEDSPLEKGNAYHNIMKESNLDINNLEKLKLMPEFLKVNEQEIVNCVLIMNKLSKDRKIYPEKMFLMNVEKNLVKQSTSNQKVLIQGIVDLILEGKDDIILVDYKTTKGSDKFLKEKYNVQLSLYAMALEDFYKKPVSKKYIYSFFKNKLIELD
ncbi:MAG: UvrD-helicase domain-containing protein [Clostridia bacterium]|nr:UvrD-helicase domain-containing protein [Clostridia bacterium]